MNIYIISSYNKTGGPRSLHQLANKLINRGYNVFMVYGNHGHIESKLEILYSDCNAKVAEKVIDVDSNFLIMPESDTSWYFKYKNINKIIWWLSLDFFKEQNLWNRAKKVSIMKEQSLYTTMFRYLKYEITYILKGHSRKYVHDVHDLKQIYHLYNCEYVHQYLLSLGVKEDKTQYLCGPVDIEKYNKNEDIKDYKLIAYNPAKVQHNYIKLLKKYMYSHYEGYRFVALEKMTHQKLQMTLNKAAVYLDLGFFPGPERIPREAVMAYCNLITSNLGSASNHIDVNIPTRFKVTPSPENIPQICKLINELCTHFSKYTNEYENYRNSVIWQIKNFDNEIDELCKYMNTEKYSGSREIG